MEIETLQAELERLFDLNSLLDLTRDVLGFDPDSVGGTTALGSYSQSLIRHCIQADATEALCDAVRILKPSASPELDKIRTLGLFARRNTASRIVRWRYPDRKSIGSRSCRHELPWALRSKPGSCEGPAPRSHARSTRITAICRINKALFHGATPGTAVQ